MYRYSSNIHVGTDIYSKTASIYMYADMNAHFGQVADPDIRLGGAIYYVSLYLNFISSFGSHSL